MKKILGALLLAIVLFTHSTSAQAVEVKKTVNYSSDTAGNWGTLWHGIEDYSNVTVDGDVVWVDINVPKTESGQTALVKGINLTIHDHDEGGEFKIYGYKKDDSGNLVNVWGSAESLDKETQLLPQKNEGSNKWLYDDIDTLGEDALCGYTYSSVYNAYYTDRYHPQHGSTPDHDGCLRNHPIVAGDPGVEKDAKITNATATFVKDGTRYYDLGNIKACSGGGCQLDTIKIKLKWEGYKSAKAADNYKYQNFHYHIGSVNFLIDDPNQPPPATPVNLKCTTTCVNPDTPNQLDNKLTFTWEGGSGTGMVFNITQDGNSFDGNTGLFWNKYPTSGNSLSIIRNEFTPQANASGALKLVPGTKYKAYVFDPAAEPPSSNTEWCTLDWCDKTPKISELKCEAEGCIDTENPTESTGTLTASWKGGSGSTTLNITSGTNPQWLSSWTKTLIPGNSYVINPNAFSPVNMSTPFTLQPNVKYTMYAHDPISFTSTNFASCSLPKCGGETIPEGCDKYCTSDAQCENFDINWYCKNINTSGAVCRLKDDLNTSFDESTSITCSSRPDEETGDNQISGKFYLTSDSSCNKTGAKLISLYDDSTVLSVPSALTTSSVNDGKGFKITIDDNQPRVVNLALGGATSYQCCAQNPGSSTKPRTCQNGQVNPGASDVDFYVYDGSEADSWWQVWGGLVYSDNNIQSKLPITSATCTSPYCESYLIRTAFNSTSNSFSSNDNSAGIPINHLGDILPNLITGWLTINPGNPFAQGADMKSNITKEDFNYFKQAVDLTDVNVISNLNYDIDINSGTERVSDAGTTYVFQTSGDLNFDPTQIWEIGTEQVIVFVNGNLTITDSHDVGQLTNVDQGGFLALIVNGSATIDSSVGNTDLENTNSNFEGIIVADSITSEASGIEGDDERLVLEGSYVGWNGISLNRSIDGVASNNTPAEVVIHRPDFVTNTPDILKASVLNWQEIN